jgi:hypothetical protein
MLDDFLSSHKQQAVADMTAKLPAKRIGTADDAAQAGLLLMTNPFMNGTSISPKSDARQLGADRDKVILKRDVVGLRVGGKRSEVIEVAPGHLGF